MWPYICDRKQDFCYNVLVNEFSTPKSGTDHSVFFSAYGHLLWLGIGIVLVLLFLAQRQSIVSTCVVVLCWRVMKMRKRPSHLFVSDLILDMNLVLQRRGWPWKVTLKNYKAASLIFFLQFFMSGEVRTGKEGVWHYLSQKHQLKWNRTNKDTY